MREWRYGFEILRGHPNPLKLRVAITNTFSWPHVRRGSERFIHELSWFLSNRGHKVTIVSTTPDGPARRSDESIAMLHYAERGRWIPARLRISQDHVFSLQSLHAFLTNDFDVVHCMTPSSAFAAGLCKMFKKINFLFHIVGIPMKAYFKAVPHDYLIFRFGLTRADETVVLSRCAEHYLEKDFRQRGALLPIPVDLEHFKVNTSTRATPPKILMSGDLEETRKGVRLLARSFAVVKKTVPSARLQLSGRISDHRRREVFDLIPGSMHGDVEVLGVGKLEDLPHLYAEATVTVLPAIWETFGMVLVESLACGTPVVGARHGGIPDIISSSDIGSLFDPGEIGEEASNVEGLAEVILRTLELAQKERTPYLCRRHAEQYGWNDIGPHFERLYYEIFEGKRKVEE